jgi:hypothetical protein
VILWNIDAVSITFHRCDTRRRAMARYRALIGPATPSRGS